MSRTNSSPSSPNTIELWHATSSSAEPGPIERCCESWLDASELERAGRFRLPTSRNQHVVGKGMSRRLLGGDSVTPASIRFGIEVHGKPFVTEPEQARQPFNVAHTDGLVLCGIGTRRNARLGVDVERLQRRTDPALANRYFSKPEINYLNSQPDAETRRYAFLRIWTLKESFIKAIGTGLQTPLADFAFEEIDADCPRIKILDSKLESDVDWKFFSIQPRPGYIGAIAAESTEAVAVSLKCFDDLVAESVTRSSSGLSVRPAAIAPRRGT